MRMHTAKTTGLVLGLWSAAVGCSSKADSSTADGTAPRSNPSEERNLIEVAEAAGSFSTLLTALRVTGLEETVRTAPALTVFAPTDDAFAALPAGALDDLLANPEALKNVLLYHVVDGAVPSSVAVTLTEASMLNGGKTTVRYDGTTLFINDSRVVAADVAASNGVIHVLDKVLLPAQPAKPTALVTPRDVIATAEAAGTFTTLLTAVRAAGLEATLREASDITVFAPTDEAFAKIPPATLQALLADQQALKNVLLYHVVGARVSAATARTLTEATMLNGSKIAIDASCEDLKINDAKVVAADVDGGNGVIHVLDTVLIP